MCDSVPPEQEEGQCGFKPTLCSAVCYKYLSSVLRTQTYMGDVSQINFIQSSAVASQSFAQAVFYKAATAQKKTWPAMKEAAVTEQPTQ